MGKGGRGGEGGRGGGEGRNLTFYLCDQSSFVLSGWPID